MNPTNRLPAEGVVTTSHWWGRRSADPATIYCTQNGWREAVWERDADGQWSETSATLRPVVWMALDGSGRYELGEPRVVKGMRR